MNNLMQQSSRMNLGARRNTNFVEVLVIDCKEFVVRRQSVLPLSLKWVAQVEQVLSGLHHTTKLPPRSFRLHAITQRATLDHSQRVSC